MLNHDYTNLTQIKINEFITAKQHTIQEYSELTEKRKTIDAILKLCSNLDESKQKSTETAQQLVDLYKKEILSFGLYSNNLPIGRISFVEIDTESPEIEIELNKDYQNKGIGYESLKKLTKIVAFTNKNVKYFIYRVVIDNLASINLIEKLGGKRIINHPLLEKVYKTYHLYV